MMRVLTLLVLLVSMLSITSCASREPTIRADAIAPLLEDVIERHDTYVASDPELSAPERLIYLESSALLRQAIDEARGTANDPTAPPAPGS